jgi:hypothetical protein
MKCRALF